MFWGESFTHSFYAPEFCPKRENSELTLRSYSHLYLGIYFCLFFFAKFEDAVADSSNKTGSKQ